MGLLIKIITTKLGWLAITLFLSLIFGIIADYYHWAERAMCISLLYPFGFILNLILYGQIIKPIKERFKNKS